MIEDAHVGRAIAQDLRRSKTCRPILHGPKFDKEARFLAQSARFESGQVHAPAKAPRLAEWLEELLAFPNGRHDDQVDPTSQALHYLSRRMSHRHPAREAPGRRRPVRRPARRVRPAEVE